MTTTKKKRTTWTTAIPFPKENRLVGNKEIPHLKTTFQHMKINLCMIAYTILSLRNDLNSVLKTLSFRLPPWLEETQQTLLQISDEGFR